MMKIISTFILIFCFGCFSFAQKNISVGLYFMPSFYHSANFTSSTAYNFGSTQGMSIHFGGRVESNFSKRFGYSLGFDFGQLTAKDSCYSFDFTEYPNGPCAIGYSETHYLLNLNPNLSFIFFQNKKSKIYTSIESSIFLRFSGYKLIINKNTNTKFQSRLKLNFSDFFFPRILLGWSYSIRKNQALFLEPSFGKFQNRRSDIYTFGMKVGIILKNIL